MPYSEQLVKSIVKNRVRRRQLKGLIKEEDLPPKKGKKTRA